MREKQGDREKMPALAGKFPPIVNSTSPMNCQSWAMREDLVSAMADKRVPRHFRRLLQTEQSEQGRRDVRQLAIA